MILAQPYGRKFRSFENMNPANNHGMTPLHFAVKYGHLDVCRHIIKNVEDKNPVDNSGNTPKDLQYGPNHEEIIKLFE